MNIDIYGLNIKYGLYFYDNLNISEKATLEDVEKKLDFEYMNYRKVCYPNKKHILSIIDRSKEIFKLLDDTNEKQIQIYFFY